MPEAIDTVPEPPLLSVEGDIDKELPGTAVFCKVPVAVADPIETPLPPLLGLVTPELPELAPYKVLPGPSVLAPGVAEAPDSDVNASGPEVEEVLKMGTTSVR